QQPPLHDGQRVFLGEEHVARGRDGNLDLERADDVAPGEGSGLRRRDGGRRFRRQGQTRGTGDDGGRPLLGGDPADDDVDLLSGRDRRGQVYGEQAGVVVAGSGRDRDVSHAPRDLALNRVGVGGGQPVAGVESRGERQHGGGRNRGPVNGGRAA